MGELALLALALVGGLMVCGVVLGVLFGAFAWFVDRRCVRHDRAVEAAGSRGYRTGEEARLAGRAGAWTDLPLLTFDPLAAARTRREVTTANCERAFSLGWLRGFRAAERARLDVEADAAAVERTEDDLERLQALANGERV